MSDFIPHKPAGLKIGGLNPRAQKLQALREKAAAANDNSSAKPSGNAASSKAKLPNGPAKKTAFQRKAT